jgi:hypothetical protein
MPIPNEIQGIAEALLSGLNAALGDKLYGLYLYGAWAFPESGATGDIDFHAILREAPTAVEKAEIEALHAALAERYPPLGAELDGYYILLKDALQTSPPRHQIYPHIVDHSWALHRAHMRAGRCFVLQGPDPLELFPAASWAELDEALQGELDFVEQHLEQYPAYGVLNLCRLIYSYETRDVVTSKRASSIWAEGRFPQWVPLIVAARKWYAHEATPDEEALLATEAARFFPFAWEQIASGRAQAGHRAP